MLDAISVDYYYKARIEELDREADRIFSARRVRADGKPENPGGLPCVPQSRLPYSGLRPKSVCR